ncbi:MAG TPA: hypothetical protein VIK40_05075 [Geomonas sp.]
MKKQSTKDLIKRVLSDLDWPILECATEMPMIRLISDHKNKSHIIYLPTKENNKSRDLDYLHELGHATLCEKVHYIFATNSQFPTLASKKQFLPLLPALSAASDWFVCHWQQEVLPAKMHKVIKGSMPVVAEILGQPTLPPIEIILDASLLIAQAVYYLDEPIDCGGVLNDIVGAFLSVPPEHPSAENLLLLVNKTMAAYTTQRARLVPEDDYLVWDVYQPCEAKEAVETGAAQLGAAV